MPFVAGYAAAGRFDRKNANQNLSLSTRRNYLQRLLEFTHAAGRLYSGKGLLDLGYDEVSSVLEAMKQGRVSTNSLKPPRRISNRTHEYHVVTLKKFYAINGRRSLARRMRTPRGGRNREDCPIIPEDDIRRLVAEAPTILERLVVELLNDTGARVSELANLRLKGVRRDEYSHILALRRKTGLRNLRTFTAGPDLARYINQHPQREDGDAILLLNERDGKPLGDLGIYRLVRNLSERVLGNRCNPHMFRRSTATRYAKQLTEYEMKLMFGWKRSESATPYVQLSMRDIDSKVLALHGIKVPKKELPVTIAITRCPSCRSENPPFAVYCQECGRLIGAGETQIATERINEVERELMSLRKALQFVQNAVEYRQRLQSSR